MGLQWHAGKLSIKDPTERRNLGMLAIDAARRGNRQVMAPYSSRGLTICDHSGPEITQVRREVDVQDAPVVSESEPTPRVIQGLRHTLVVHVGDRTAFV